MTDAPPTNESLLPPHLSELERDLDSALALIDKVEIPIETLWNPWTCPLNALPYLAWALRVFSWGSEWREQTKRQVVSDSLFIHRNRGTRPAVEKAIESVKGDSVRIVEWFEEPENLGKAEFSVDYISTHTPIDLGNLQELIPLINSAKNVRSHLKHIRITSQTETFKKYLTFCRQSVLAKSGPWRVDSLVSPASSTYFCLSRQAIQIRSGPLSLE